MIKGSINLDKIDMSRVRTDSNGKGRFIDFIQIETPNDKYGNDAMLVQSISAEERAAGIKGPIIGNCKDTKKQKA
jgi:hypothetical protein